jgi:hypothetical protein
MSSIPAWLISDEADGDDAGICIPGIFISVLVGAGVGEEFGFVVWACTPATENNKTLSRTKHEHTTARFRAATEKHLRNFRNPFLSRKKQSRLTRSLANRVSR